MSGGRYSGRGPPPGRYPVSVVVFLAALSIGIVLGRKMASESLQMDARIANAHRDAAIDAEAQDDREPFDGRLRKPWGL